MEFMKIFNYHFLGYDKEDRKDQGYVCGMPSVWGTVPDSLAWREAPNWLGGAECADRPG